MDGKQLRKLTMQRKDEPLSLLRWTVVWTKIITYLIFFCLSYQYLGNKIISVEVFSAFSFPILLPIGVHILIWRVTFEGVMKRVVDWTVYACLFSIFLNFLKQRDGPTAFMLIATTYFESPFSYPD